MNFFIIDKINTLYIKKDAFKRDPDQMFIDIDFYNMEFNDYIQKNKLKNFIQLEKNKNGLYPIDLLQSIDINEPIVWFNVFEKKIFSNNNTWSFYNKEYIMAEQILKSASKNKHNYSQNKIKQYKDLVENDLFSVSYHVLNKKEKNQEIKLNKEDSLKFLNTLENPNFLTKLKFFIKPQFVELNAHWAVEGENKKELFFQHILQYFTQKQYVEQLSSPIKALTQVFEEEDPDSFEAQEQWSNLLKSIKVIEEKQQLSNSIKNTAHKKSSVIKI